MIRLQYCVNIVISNVRRIPRDFSDQVSSTTDICVQDQREQNSIPDDTSDITESISASSSESSKPMDSSDEQDETNTFDYHQSHLTAQRMAEVMNKQLKMKKVTSRKRKISQNIKQRKRLDLRIPSKASTIKRPTDASKETFEQKTTSDRAPEDTWLIQCSTNSSSEAFAPQFANKQVSNTIKPLPSRAPMMKKSKSNFEGAQAINHIPTWSRMDSAGGPQGPPNITWRSSEPLKSVKSYFTSPNEIDNFGLRPLGAQNFAEDGNCRDQPTFVDQTDFLAEQASILEGRTNDVDSRRLLQPVHGLCRPRPAAMQSNYSSHIADTSSATRRVFRSNLQAWRATQPLCYTTLASAMPRNFRPIPAMSDHPTSSRLDYYACQTPLGRNQFEMNRGPNPYCSTTSMQFL